MKTEEDIVRVRLVLIGTIEIDRERMVEDPNWEQITSLRDLSNPEVLRAVIAHYINHYVVRDRLLMDMPSSNGPGELIATNIDIQFHEDKEKYNVSDSNCTSTGQERQGKRPGDAELSAEDQ